VLVCVSACVRGYNGSVYNGTTTVLVLRCTKQRHSSELQQQCRCGTQYIGRYHRVAVTDWSAATYCADGGVKVGRW
jgi:hypothetical protein